jgi:predicted transcriptional regulator of viral defense system
LIQEFKRAVTCKEVADAHKVNPYVVLFLAGKLLEKGVLVYAN